MGKVEAPSPVVAALREFFTTFHGQTLLAVSGGADSVALLTAAAGLHPARIGVASINHGLRPASADEVDTVRRLATTLGVPFHSASLGLSPGAGMEARAREARYAALEALRSAFGYAWIATAHTREDQAETLLMRLSRGASLRGAGSIRARAGRLVRPLLRVGRADTVAYVEAQGLTPVRDPSNQDPALLRARVRASVLPALVAAAGPASVKHLAAFAARAAEDEVLLAEQASVGLARARVPGGLDAVGLRSLLSPLRRRALVGWLEESGVPVSAALLGKVEAALDRGGRCGLPGRRLLRCEGGLVRIAVPAPVPAPVELTTGVWVPFGGYRLRLDVGLLPGASAFALGTSAGSFRVRGRRPGDRVEAGPGRRRAVQDVLLDARIPAEQRAAWPLLVDASDRVLWVVGLWPPLRNGVQGLAVRAEPTSATAGERL
jgi:tRNA(Ile)-lysidine synthase